MMTKQTFAASKRSLTYCSTTMNFNQHKKYEFKQYLSYTHGHIFPKAITHTVGC